MVTRLDIINQMLATLGTAPVTSEDTLHPDFITANQLLDSLDTEMQLRGWWFNRMYVKLSQTTAGRVVVPDGTLSVDPTDTTSKLVRVGNTLFDTASSTDIIGSSVDCVIVTKRDIPDMPPAAALALQGFAKYMYFLDKDGAEPKLSHYARLSAKSMAMLNSEELKHRDINAFNSPRTRRALPQYGGGSTNPNFPGGRTWL